MPRLGSRGVGLGGIALQPDGKIVAAGTDGSDTTGNQLVMVRYQPDGSLDSGFGTAGQVRVDNAGGGKTVIQPDGKIVVAGIIPNPGTCQFIPNVARFNPDGTLDTGFGSGGVVRGFGDPCSFSTVVALQADGKIVLAGNANTSPGWVVRLTSSGAPDSLFGTAGKAPGIQASDVALQPDGRIVVVGGRASTFDVARLNTTGAVDATFGTGGKVSTDFGPGMSGSADGVAIQPDGRIVVAGSVGSSVSSRFGLVRYNPNGGLETTFGAGGRVTTAFDTAQASAAGVALQSDGRIVVAGSASPSGTTSTFAVARYLGDAPVADANQRFLNQLYLDLLGRTIDPSGQATWSAMLTRGVSRTQVTLQIEGSAEYRTRQVQDFYGLLLNRSPDSTGLAAFTGFLGAGGTVDQVKASILGSGEYFTSRSGGTNDGFLAALYRDVLGRAIDASGQATWGGALRAGASRQSVAQGVVTSLEADQVLVQGDYRQLLRREADSSGLSTFVGFLQRGGRDEEVLASIAGSDEYFARLRG
jgi:uncharacterized delta-60 repeat protein